MQRSLCALWVLLLCNGCLQDEVDAADPGVFSCESASDCGDEEFCVLGRCELEAPPSIEIRDPEQFEIIASQEGVGSTMLLSVVIGGTGLELVDPGAGMGRSGEGYVEVMLDGLVVGELTAGSLAGNVLLAVPDFQATPGAHRIVARAYRSDGTAYDNASAEAVSLVWVDDGQPQVGIVRPIPGTVFDVEETEIDVEVATLNFSIVPAAATRPEAHGHAHIHYDDVFPSCVDDPLCDCCYIAIASPNTSEVPAQGFLLNWTEAVTLPGASAGAGRVSAVLRSTNHTPFYAEDGRTVFSSIEVQRVARGGP